MATSAPKVIVAGGGIGGCAAAIALHRAGVDVTVYEKVHDMKEFGAGVNVAGPAISALAKLGVEPSAFSDASFGNGVPIFKERLYTTDGLLISETDVSKGQHAIHRAKLLDVLVAECRRLLGDSRVLLGHEFVSMRQTGDGVAAIFKRVRAGARCNASAETHQTHGKAFASVGELLPEVHADCLIGCDGLKSVVRAALVDDGAPRYTGRVLYRGLAEVDTLLPDAIQVCGASQPHGPGVFLAYPINETLRTQGRSLVNWLLYTTQPAPKEGESWANRASLAELRPALEQLSDNTQYGGFTPMDIAEAAADQEQPVVGWALFDRDPLATWDFGTATLLGDAAHPMLPYGGQGASQALVDAVALGTAFAAAQADGSGVRGAVRAYSDMRCEATGKIVIQNRSTMGPVGGIDFAHESCQGMSRDEKEVWLRENKGSSAEIQRFYHNKLVYGKSTEGGA